MLFRITVSRKTPITSAQAQVLNGLGILTTPCPGTDCYKLFPETQFSDISKFGELRYLLMECGACHIQSIPIQEGGGIGLQILNLNPCITIRTR